MGFGSTRGSLTALPESVSPDWSSSAVTDSTAIGAAVGSVGSTAGMAVAEAVGSGANGAACRVESALSSSTDSVVGESSATALNTGAVSGFS